MGPLGGVHENCCTGDNVRKCIHALFCSRAVYWEGMVLLIVLVTICGFVSLPFRFLLLFLPVVSPDKCSDGLVISPCFVSGTC